MWAPASTWAMTSRSTRLKSPALHLLGEQLAAGRVDPLADDDERLVEADDDLAAGRGDDGPGHSPAPRAAATPPAATRAASSCLAVGRLEPAGLVVRLGLEVVAARLLGLAPLRDVVVHRPLAGLDRGLVDGDLEARVEDDLARPAAVLGDDLGGDVAPPDDGQRARPSGGPGGGRRRSAVERAAASRRRGRPGWSPSSPSPVARRSNASPRRSAARRARSVSSGIVGLGQVDEPAVVAEVDRQQLRVAVEPEARRRPATRSGGPGSRSGRTSPGPRRSAGRRPRDRRRTRSSGRRPGARRPRRARTGSSSPPVPQSA